MYGNDFSFSNGKNLFYVVPNDYILIFLNNNF